MGDLLALKKALEKPGVGKHRHDIANEFKTLNGIPEVWIREWLDADWHTIGCQYLWLAAMNACIGRSNVPIDILYKGLRKTDPDTFNAAIEACHERKLPFSVILEWYNSSSTILQLAAINACIGNLLVPKWFIEQAKSNHDIRIRKIANQISD